MYRKIKMINVFLIIFLGILILNKINFNQESVVALETDAVEKNLMIVAHPDDETLWGGSHLIDDDYLVVCVTCGVREDRVEEFEQAMKKTDDEFIILGYPDKVDGKQSNWDDVYDDLEDELKNLINQRNWKIIVTHNPDGEYGHNHHKMVSKIVTKVSDKNKLYYFGKYYDEDDLEDETKISEKNYDKKLELIEVYETQRFVKDLHGQMFEYENWIPYSEWK